MKVSHSYKLFDVIISILFITEKLFQSSKDINKLKSHLKNASTDKAGFNKERQNILVTGSVL